MEIPLVYSRLKGGTVRDLVEALSRLDPDTKTEIQEVQSRVDEIGPGRRVLVLCLPNLDQLTV